jgi:myosin heavy subunit
MLSAKMDLLMKRLEEQAPGKKEVMQLFESRMTCEGCGNTRHSGRQCPQLEEDVNYINNNNQYRPQQNQGWTQQRTNYPDNYSVNYQGNNSSNNFSPLKDLVHNQGRIMDNLSKKLASNDKILETISNKIESFSSAIKNQHSFNKMLESHISQLAPSIPTANPGKILGQLKELEFANLVDVYSADLCSSNT